MGKDVLNYTKEKGVDVIVMYSDKKTGFYNFLTKNEYEIVSEAPCVVLVTLPAVGD
jgi:hypothetical protein